MRRLYAQWIGGWEHRLANHDTNRVTRPFDWGWDWLDGIEVNGNPVKSLEAYSARMVARSDSFFSYDAPRQFELTGGTLRFPSPLQTPHERNNTVYADYFPSRRANGRAVLVLPQWNSDSQSHSGLCKLLNRFGISALRLSLAYHDRRMPPELQRADYHMSSNLGRTIHATRQSVVDGRACLDWLTSRGYQRLGIVGISLGSCISLLITAHDQRIRSGVFNHVSMNVGEVVWSGISCRHIKKSIAEHVSQEQLVRCWSVISPSSYLERLVGRELPALLVWASHDTTFLPQYSRDVLDSFRRLNLPHKAICLPCGHYTSGKMPFALWDGLAIARFIRNTL